MKVQETLSYSFYSSDLNENKYLEFLNKANAIKEFKNALSLEISNNLEKYLDYNKFSFVKEYGKTKNNPFTSSNLIRGNELQKAAADVFDSYQNKFDAIIRKIRFFIQKEMKISYYKRKTKDKEAGDLKEFKIEKHQTKICFVLGYLARYWNDSLLDYLNSLEKKNQLQEDVLKYLDKYGKRLIDLALLRKENVIQKYSEPIEFKASTYRSALQTTDLLIQEKNKTKLSNCYICIPSINGSGSRKVVVPSKIHSKHHGRCKDFKSQEYIVQVQEDLKRVRFIVTKDVEREYFIGGEEFLGVDTNLKHNLFCLSTGNEIDIDRSFFKAYTCFLKKIDQKEKLSKGEEKQKKLWQTRIDTHLKEKSSELVKKAISLGKNHVVMEDLNLSDKTYKRNDELNGFKYSRLTKLMHLASLDEIVKSICRREGIQFSTIPSHYTSQMCSNCGCIEKENRPIQETFNCISCNETRNADFNASINIALIGQYEVTYLKQNSQKVSGCLLVEGKKTKWFSAKSIYRKEFVKNRLVAIVTSPTFQSERRRLLQELESSSKCTIMQSQM